jgi:cysteine desulfurase/selenocysteine lyase
MSLDINQVRSDFPQVHHEFENGPIMYFDSAATTLKPKCVIDTLNNYYLKECANVHRGIHTISEISTNNFEKTRKTLQKFINSKYEEEIIFTSGTTHAINLVSLSWGPENLAKDDEILVSELEHHSNIVPWQMLCEKTGAKLVAFAVNQAGEIDLDDFKAKLNSKTKLLSTAYISNTLGTINPIEEMIKLCRENKTVTLIDAAQAMAHKTVDVQALDCDFLVMSAHKIFGPTGVGILYGKRSILESMPPLFGGGDMIDSVTFEKTTYNTLPHKLEAGTPNIAGVIAFNTALEYVMKLGLDNIEKYEEELLSYATEKLSSIPGLKIIGTAKNKSAVISFNIDGLHAHDIATIANKYNIALRTGHHCTQPLLKKLGVPATARASFSIYNTKEEINHLYESLAKIKELFG